MSSRKLSDKKVAPIDECRSGAVREDDLGSRLVGYSVIAGAALLGGQQAEAGIIYSGPLAIDFGVNDGSKQITMEGAAAEMVLEASGASRFMAARSNDSFQVLNYATNTDVLRPLLAPAKVGSGTILPAHMAGEFYDSVAGGEGAWETPGEINFFGFSFEEEGSGTTLYGWAQVQRLATMDGRLLGWAYEDSGGSIEVGAKPVPEPSTLALYALGAAGVAACRRRRRRQKDAEGR